MPYLDNETRKIYSLNYYHTHKNYWKTSTYKEKKAMYDLQYHKKHAKKIKTYNKKYVHNKRLTDINFKLACYLRNRIRYALKNNPKLEITARLVNCSIDQLKNHLESKFTKGMSWSNYGKWHVDHIRPCASFDLSKAAEQKKCFHYTNLQPLWAHENRVKNAKVI